LIIYEFSELPQLCGSSFFVFCLPPTAAVSVLPHPRADAIPACRDFCVAVAPYQNDFRMPQFPHRPIPVSPPSPYRHDFRADMLCMPRVKSGGMP